MSTKSKSQKQTFAMSSVQGARYENQDFVSIEESEDFLYGVVCDGHGNGIWSKQFGNSFMVALQESLHSWPLPENESTTRIKEDDVDDVIELVAHVYYDTLNKLRETPLNDHEGGTTVCAFVFNKVQNICCVLQLGDSRCIISDLEGSIVRPKEVFRYDFAYPYQGTEKIADRDKLCMTTAHSFTPKGEEAERWKEKMAQCDCTFKVAARTDASKAEERFLAKLIPRSSRFMSVVNLPEPSRVIESRTQNIPEDWADVILQCQENPTVDVWFLDATPKLFCLCSDGFESKKALDVSDIPLFLCKPESFIKSPKPFDKTNLLPVFESLRYMSFDEGVQKLQKNIAPDEHWKKAIQESKRKVDEIIKENVPTISEDIENVVNCAVNYAVVCGSDDNCTLAAALAIP